MIKFVKLTGYTYACNSLTNFESENRKRKSSEFVETSLGKIREITSSNLMFGGFLAIWNHRGFSSNAAKRGRGEARRVWRGTVVRAQ